MYIRRFRYLSEVKAQKDLEHSLFNFVLFSGREKDGSEFKMKQILLDLCVSEVLKLEDKRLGAGLQHVLHNTPLF